MAAAKRYSAEQYGALKEDEAHRAEQALDISMLRDLSKGNRADGEKVSLTKWPFERARIRAVVAPTLHSRRSLRASRRAQHQTRSVDQGSVAAGYYCGDVG